MDDRSLPLFDDRAPSGRSRDGTRRRRARQRGGDTHLEAARRLARNMARLEERSPEQFAAGAKICRHLIAMLKDSTPNDTQHSRH